MSTSQQPIALRLADKYEVRGFLGDQRYAKDYWCSQAAVELRRQHARIVELEEMLRREVQHSAGLRVAPIATSPEAKSDTYRCQAPQGYVRPQEPDSHDGHDYEGFIGGCQRMGCQAQGTDSRDATQIAWYVTGCSTMLDEHDAKAEAKRCGGSAKAVPLYTAPPASPAHADAQVVLPDSAPTGMCIVNAGALQMVINALRRDAEEGKVVRGEMADELLATVHLWPEPAAWLATFRPKGVLSSNSVAGVDLEELKRSVPSDSVFKPLYAQPS